MWDIHGDEVAYDFTAAQGPRKPETLWDEYQWALAEARAILSRQITPQPAFSSVCKLCHWYNFCVDELTRLDDLTLIPFLGRPLRDALQKTFPTIASLAAANPEDHIRGSKTTFKGLGADRLKLFHARALMLKQEKPNAYLRTSIALPVDRSSFFSTSRSIPCRTSVICMALSSAAAARMILSALFISLWKKPPR